MPKLTPAEQRIADRALALSVGANPDAQGWEHAVLQRHGEWFEETGDPLLPWSMLEFASERGLPVPAWVMDYLAGRADHLIRAALSGKSRGHGSAGREAEAVGKALGFGGQGPGETSVGGRMRQRTRYWSIAKVVAVAVARGWPKEAAVAEARRLHGVGKSTVYQALERYGERAELVVAGLRRDGTFR